MHSPPRGQDVGDAWGTMFALPVVKGHLRKPVRVVEEALTESARANYFQSFPEQARAWRMALIRYTRPPDFQAWLALRAWSECWLERRAMHPSKRCSRNGSPARPQSLR
eukprot:7530362-Pyramimonas_sp.AAC.1